MWGRTAIVGEHPLDHVTRDDIDRHGRSMTAGGPVPTVRTTPGRPKQDDGERFDLAGIVAAKHGQDS